MTSAAAFLGGAKSRLLPASVPFRFFAAAVVFHVLAWLALFAAADELPGFAGGPGLLLAALHLLTLGVLTMTAMGAAFQLLPVATRRPMARVWPARLCFWLLAPGTLTLAYGMATSAEGAMYAGGSAAAGSLLIFAVMITDNLRRARGLPVVAAHGWAALVSLIGFAGLGLALVFNFTAGFLPDHQSAVLAHMMLAGFGFMGLLALGFSHILIPMFALSHTLPAPLAWREFWLASTACAVATMAAITGNQIIWAAAAALGLAAYAAYIMLMRAALDTGMRKRLGVSFVMIKLSWIGLAACLALGAAIVLAVPVPNDMTLFGFMLIVGWLLTFLTGILQRIMPFLASMHATDKSGQPARLSELTADLPLRIHAVCHIGAVLMCSASILVTSPVMGRLGATAGLIGVAAFAAFAARIVSRLTSSSH